MVLLDGLDSPEAAEPTEFACAGLEAGSDKSCRAAQSDCTMRNSIRRDRERSIRSLRVPRSG